MGFSKYNYHRCSFLRLRSMDSCGRESAHKYVHERTCIWYVSTHYSPLYLTRYAARCFPSPSIFTCGATCVAHCKHGNIQGNILDNITEDIVGFDVAQASRSADTSIYQAMCITRMHHVQLHGLSCVRTTHHKVAMHCT